MVVLLTNWSRSQANARPVTQPSAFGGLLRSLRIAAQLSQHDLARRARIDPGYVNRLERAPQLPARVSRPIVVRLWLAVGAEADDLDRLLAAAGLLPDSIIMAGGWDAYLRTWRGQVALLERKLELRVAYSDRLAHDLVTLREERS